MRCRTNTTDTTIKDSVNCFFFRTWLETLTNTNRRSLESNPSRSHSYFSISDRLKTSSLFILLNNDDIFFLITEQCSGATAYYGKLIGKLSQLHHGVSGEVYAVDARTLFIKDFTYDGEAPGLCFSSPPQLLHATPRLVRLFERGFVYLLGLTKLSDFHGIKASLRRLGRW